jgi:hypothetical protein
LIEACCQFGVSSSDGRLLFVQLVSSVWMLALDTQCAAQLLYWCFAAAVAVQPQRGIVSSSRLYSSSFHSHMPNTHRFADCAC